MPDSAACTSASASTASTPSTTIATAITATPLVANATVSAPNTRTTARFSTNITRPRPPLPIRFSPQVRPSSEALSFTACTGPTSRATSTGTVRKVATVQATPIRPTTIRPTKPARSSIARSSRPTVAAMAA